MRRSLVITLGLTRVVRDGIAFWTDPDLANDGVRIAFSERTGGVSAPPFDSLNLAAHVGDDPAAVDKNRSRFMAAVGLSALRDQVVTAQQVHGDQVRSVAAEHAGRGASAVVNPAAPGAGSPIAEADGLATVARELPLMLFFADCVPVILAVAGDTPGVAVVHAGWRGALNRIPEKGIEALLEATGANVSSIRAYIGPHIGSCCYKVATTLTARFEESFGTIAAVDDRLDLSSAVRASMNDAGVADEQIAVLGSCTLDHVDRFFSYRANDVTGRHGALAVITKD